MKIQLALVAGLAAVARVSGYSYGGEIELLL
jgi:hypothetical protein